MAVPCHIDLGLVPAEGAWLWHVALVPRSSIIGLLLKACRAVHSPWFTRLSTEGHTCKTLLPRRGNNEVGKCRRRVPCNNADSCSLMRFGPASRSDSTAMLSLQ